MYIHVLRTLNADPSGGAVYGVGVRPLACWIAGSNPAGALMSYECFVSSGSGLCDWPIPRPGESYRLCVYNLVRSNTTITLHIQ
jgi:hypothetical protein